MHVMKIKWNKKVAPHKIIKFYNLEASNRLSHEDLHDVALDIYLRVKSCVNATNGIATCPVCDADVLIRDEASRCGDCGQAISRTEFMASKRHRDLNVANAEGCFVDFMKKYESGLNDKELILAIDFLIHEFHWQLSHSENPNRSVGNNLIDGSHEDVIELLSALSSKDGVDLRRWNQLADAMRKRRRGDQPGEAAA